MAAMLLQGHFAAGEILCPRCAGEEPGTPRELQPGWTAALCDRCRLEVAVPARLAAAQRLGHYLRYCSLATRLTAEEGGAVRVVYERGAEALVIPKGEDSFTLLLEAADHTRLSDPEVLTGYRGVQERLWSLQARLGRLLHQHVHNTRTALWLPQANP